MRQRWCGYGTILLLPVDYLLHGQCWCYETNEIGWNMTRTIDKIWEVDRTWFGFTWKNTRVAGWLIISLYWSLFYLLAMFLYGTYFKENLIRTMKEALLDIISRNWGTCLSQLRYMFIISSIQMNTVKTVCRIWSRLELWFHSIWICV